MATSDAEAASVAAAQMREDMVSAYEEAVRKGQDAIDSWIDASKEMGRPVPRPKISA